MTYATQPRTTVHSLQVATNLHHFIESQVLPDTGISAHDFWQGFDAIVQDLAPKNIALLAERDRLQTELDLWHKKNPGQGSFCAKGRAQFVNGRVLLAKRCF